MNNYQPYDIDALMQNTWLQVISLKHGPAFKEGEGLLLWQRCLAEVEKVQQALKQAGLDESSCRHILYAHCALLDEAVKGREVQDDACVKWYDIPMQGHFLGTIDAGDRLCDRMQEVLRQAAPENSVITCFHRVMMLGFKGSFPSEDDAGRLRLIQALSAQAAPLPVPPERPLLSGTRSVGRLAHWLSSWQMHILLSILFSAAVWWGLNRWLDHLLATLLPGGIQ